MVLGWDKDLVALLFISGSLDECINDKLVCLFRVELATRQGSIGFEVRANFRDLVRGKQETKTFFKLDRCVLLIMGIILVH